jgi:hypothetical protein
MVSIGRPPAACSSPPTASNMPAPRQLLCYFGHHKCASTWVHNIVETVCDEAGWRSAYLANNDMFDHDLPAWLGAHPTEFLSFVNADWEHVRKLDGNYRGFHMVRDPRDILASAYFSHLHSHKTEAWPALVEHRKRLAATDMHEGLMLELEFNADVFEQMATWDRNQSQVLELKMEEFTTDPLNGWVAVFRHLGIIDEEHKGKLEQIKSSVRSALNVAHHHGRWPLGKRLSQLPAGRLLSIVHENRFETKTGGRKEGQELVTSHYRKGVAGDWANHFSDAHVDAFKARYNDLLIQLGYEHSPDWGLPG